MRKPRQPSAEELPATGISIGIDRVLTVLDQLGKTTREETRTEVLVLQFDSDSERPALAMVGRLRRAGINTEIWYHSDRLGKQIAQADKRGIPIVLFQGPDEREGDRWMAKLRSA